MVQKTAAIGAGIVVGMSAPIALAIPTAEARGIALIGIARGNAFEIFSHPARVAMATDAERPLAAPRRGGRDATRPELIAGPENLSDFRNKDLWCARRDSNPHGVTHCHLKAARLPVPPRALGDAGLRLEGRPAQRRRSNKSIEGVQACKGPEFHSFAGKFLAFHPNRPLPPAQCPYRVPGRDRVLPTLSGPRAATACPACAAASA